MQISTCFLETSADEENPKSIIIDQNEYFKSHHTFGGNYIGI
jgi:hypothetical protein